MTKLFSFIFTFANKDEEIQIWMRGKQIQNMNEGEIEWIIWTCCTVIKHRKPVHSKVVEMPLSVIQYSTVQYSTVQYSTVQYSTVQYSTVQYSTVQYSTVHQKFRFELLSGLLLLLHDCCQMFETPLKIFACVSLRYIKCHGWVGGIEVPRFTQCFTPHYLFILIHPPFI